MKNWFLKLSDFPLPEATEYPSIRNNTLNDYNRDISNNVVFKLKEIYPNLRYIGSGANGIAYETGNGTVLKMTKFWNEYYVAKNLIEKPVNCIVKIYKVHNIIGVYFIEMEKTKVLDQDLKNAVDDFYGKLWSRTKSLDEILNEINDRYTIIGNKQQLKVINDYYNLIKCLRYYGYLTDDTHGENVGYNNEGKLVLFDLGDSI